MSFVLLNLLSHLHKIYFFSKIQNGGFIQNGKNLVKKQIFKKFHIRGHFSEKKIKKMLPNKIYKSIQKSLVARDCFFIHLRSH
jgi:hypothetical protein